jgi:hypothetical protein
MGRTNLNQPNLCEAIEARCTNALEGAADYTARCECGFDQKLVIFSYRAFMSLALAQPKEKATKTTQETTSIFFRP